MAPATTTVHEAPDLEGVDLRERRRDSRIGTKATAAIDLDRPRLVVRASRSPELEGAVPRVRQLSCCWAVEWDHLLTTRKVVCRVHALIVAGIALHPNLQELAHAGIATFPAVELAVAVGVAGDWAVGSANDVIEWDDALRSTPVAVFEQVDEIEALAGTEPTEVDDDVPTFRDRLFRQYADLRAQRAIEGDSVLHDVAIVGDPVERHGASAAIDEGELEVAGDAAIEDAQAVLAGADVEIGVILLDLGGSDDLAFITGQP